MSEPIVLADPLKNEADKSDELAKIDKLDKLDELDELEKLNNKLNIEKDKVENEIIKKDLNINNLHNQLIDTEKNTEQIKSNFNNLKQSREHYNIRTEKIIDMLSIFLCAMILILIFAVFMYFDATKFNNVCLTVEPYEENVKDYFRSPLDMILLAEKKMGMKPGFMKPEYSAASDLNFRKPKQNGERLDDDFMWAKVHMDANIR
jgi:hypothetical protein